MNLAINSIEKMNRLIVLVLFNLFFLLSLIWPQSIGDFRTVDTGSPFDWSNTSTWEVYNGSDWDPATAYPGQNIGTPDVTIRSDGSADVTLDVTPAYAIDSLEIQTGASLTMDTGNNLTVIGSVLLGGTLDPGSQTIYFDVAATFTINGTFNGTNSTLNFAGSGTYTIESDIETVNLGNINYVPATAGTNVLNFQPFTTGTPTFNINGIFTRGQRTNSVTKDADAEISYVNGTLKYTNIENITVGAEWPSTTDTGTPPQLVDMSATGSTTVTNLNKSVNADSFIIKSREFDINVAGALSINDLLEIQGGTLDRNGTLIYTNGSILKYNAASEYAIADEWYNPNNVVVTGAGANLITNYSFTTMTVGPGGTVNENGDITINATLRHNAPLRVYGDVVGGSGNFGVADNGTLVLYGSNDADVDLSNTFRVRNLTVNKTASGRATLISGATLQLDANSVSSLFYIQSGTFEFEVTSTALQLLNGGTHNLQINSGATLETGGKDITGLTISASNGTIVFDGNTIETLPTNVTLGTVQINNSAGVDASTGTLTINTQLNLLSGELNTTSDNRVLLDIDATAAGTSYVVGPLQKQFNDTYDTFAFPVGTDALRSATFEYTESTVWNGISIIEIEHSTDGFLVTKTLPAGISSVDQNSHYIVREAGSPPTDVYYTFTGTFEDGNFTPETRNRILIEESSAYSDTASTNAVNSETNTVSSGTFNALPLGSQFIVFGGTIPTNEIAWDGGGSDNSWFTPLNWDTDEVPGDTSYVTIDGSVNVLISGTNAECASLTLGDGTSTTQLTIGTDGYLDVYETSGTPLVVENNATLELNTSTDPAINFNPGGTATYIPARTNFMSGSEVQYGAGNIEQDNYSNLVIDGTSATDGDGLITVGGDLTVSAAFSVNDPITLNGLNSTYNHTGGDVDYTSDLTVNGLQFNLTGGEIDGTVIINVPNITVNGGSFNITSTNSSVTFGGSSSQTISNAVTFYDLTINKTANNLTLNGATNVAGTLILTNGLINSNNGLLTIASGTSGNDNSYVYGPLVIEDAIGSQTFPIGKSLYRPVITDLTSDGTVNVQFEAEDFAPNYSFSAPLVDISKDRYYLGQIISGSITGGSVTLSYGEGDGVVEFDESGDVVVARSTDNSTNPYSNLGGQSSGTAPSGSVTSTTSVGTSLGYFTLGTLTGDNPLPVELAAFEAMADYTKIELTWTTASESNNLGFNIYKNTAAEDSWNKVNSSLIKGQGTVSYASDYSFVDSKIIAGETYRYKLESVSVNGLVIEEKIVEVTVPIPDQYALLNNYPNPFNPTTNIKFHLPEAQQIRLAVYDLNGSLVRTLTNDKLYPSGEHIVSWDATDNAGNRVATGIYLYRFQAGKFTKTGKMILVK